MASLVKLDYDMKQSEAHKLYHKGEKIVTEIVGLHVVDDWWVSSKRNWHVRVTFKEDLSPLEVLAVQLIMGSDVVREAFNLRRIRRGQRNWNILFTE